MEFEDLGKHCEHPGCNQKDFLPFVCDCCHKTFCLSHRSYRTHECPKSGLKDTHAIECPLCAGSIRITGDEDANVAFERHTKTLCRPSRRKERKHKKRCGASGCNKKLTLTNTVVCDDCHMEVCLAHRYADAHHCTAASARTRSPAAAKASFLSRFVAPAPKRKPVARATAAARANKAAALARQRQRARKARQARERAVKKQQADPSNTLVGSAARRMRGTDRVGAQPAAAAAAAPASSSSGGAAVAAVPVPSSLLAGVGRGREVCPTCHARFEAVTDLVAHVESWHGAGSGSQPVPTPTAVARAPARATGSTPCPNCGAAFFDPVDLVTHCESGQCPRTRRQSSCLVS